MIRVCPKRDAICPHGLDCPFTLDRYTCKEEPTIRNGNEVRAPAPPIYVAQQREP